MIEAGEWTGDWYLVCNAQLSVILGLSYLKEHCRGGCLVWGLHDVFSLPTFLAWVGGFLSD